MWMSKILKMKFITAYKTNKMFTIITVQLINYVLNVIPKTQHMYIETQSLYLSVIH